MRLEILALASFIWDSLNLTSFLHMSVLVILLGAFIPFIFNLYIKWLAFRAGHDARKLAPSISLTFSPLLLLFLVFLQRYVCLKNIQGIVLFCAVIGSGLLHILFLTRLRGTIRETDEAGKSWFSPLIIFLVTLCIYVLIASGQVFPSHPLTGDEPHYLIITKSILSDGDINLSNNYQNKDYLEFYPGELSLHARQGKKGEHFLYSVHNPALPALLSPFYFIGEKIGGRKTLVFMTRLPLCVLAALLSLVFFLVARDFLGGRRPAFVSWLVLSFASPLLFYSHLIYPEVPVALITLLTLRFVVFKKKFTPSSLFLLGVGIALLPWFGVKYLILSGGLFCIAVFSLLKYAKKKLLNILVLLAPLLVLAGLFFSILWSLYGNFSPVSIYSKISGHFHMKPIEFFRTGVGYLLDQRVGILAFSPVFVLFIPGIFLSIKKSKRESLLLLFLFLLYWSFCSLFYYWGGYCPPGRTLLPVLMIMALFMAMALKEKREVFLSAFQKALLFLSFLVTLIAARIPALLYNEEISSSLNIKGTYSHFLASLSNSLIDFRNLIPSLTNREHILWIPLCAWLLVMSFSTFFYLRKSTEKIQNSSSWSLKSNLAIVFLLSFLSIGYTFSDIHLDKERSFEMENYTLFFQDDYNYGKEGGGFWTKGKSRTSVLIQTPAPASQVRLTLSGVGKGQTSIQVGKDKRLIQRNKNAGLEKTVEISKPVGFPWKDYYLYFIQVKEDEGFVPYQIDSSKKDNRFLGVFVRIKVKVSEQYKL